MGGICLRGGGRNGAGVASCSKLPAEPLLGLLLLSGSHPHAWGPVTRGRVHIWPVSNGAPGIFVGRCRTHLVGLYSFTMTLARLRRCWNVWRTTRYASRVFFSRHVDHT